MVLGMTRRRSNLSGSRSCVGPGPPAGARLSVRRARVYRLRGGWRRSLSRPPRPTSNTAFTQRNAAHIPPIGRPLLPGGLCPLFTGGARNDVLAPSSFGKCRGPVVSYPDLMGLRIIYWLRQTKEVPDGKAVGRTLHACQSAKLAARSPSFWDLRLWRRDTGLTLRTLDRRGNIVNHRSLMPRVANTASVRLAAGARGAAQRHRSVLGARGVTRTFRFRAAGRR